MSSIYLCQTDGRGVGGLSNVSTYMLATTGETGESEAVHASVGTTGPCT